jgi:signal transduction histidine kinase
MDKVNILLVDDQPGKLLSYRSILEGLGENLVPVASGREALQWLLKEDCALILLDVVMPEMDGFETAAIIRQRPRLERTPILFLTSHCASDMDRLKGYELGAVDFVFAPVVPEILRAKVLVFVELYRNRRELAITNQKLLEEIAERKRAQEQALQRERLSTIGQMVAGLAHESRNALQQIQSALEMLRRRIQGSLELSMLAEIQKANDRLHRLLENVRNYAAPLKLECEAHDLPKIWQEAWNQLAPARQGRDVTFKEDLGQLDLECWVDPFRLELLFRNIFENALAACNDPVYIGLRCSTIEWEGRSVVKIRIADNGTGLSDEQRQRIFEPFYTTKARGTGLGMAIAKRVVEAHGGQISAAEDVRSGTAIDVLIPKDRP